MAAGPPPRGVMVCVRTRPTAAFAQDEILIDEAANVRAAKGRELGHPLIASSRDSGS